MKKTTIFQSIGLNSKKFFLNLSFTLLGTLIPVQSILAESVRPLPPRGPIPFYLYDINADGGITPDEFRSIRKQRLQVREAAGYPAPNAAMESDFGQFDKDNNARLSPEELARGQLKQKQRHMQMHTTHGMGQGQGMRQNSTMKGG